MAYPPDIARALDYPYARPAGSYLFASSGTEAFPPDVALAGRIPVLACGSNAAPGQLARKYARHPETVIPVTAAILRDMACCYSAHVTGYGAIPATLDLAPGAITYAHITWLTEMQLDEMHASEAIGINYRYVRMDGIDLTCEREGRLSSIHGYISLHGSCLINNAPAIVAGIRCENAPFPILDQHGMQRYLLERMAPAMSLTDFIRQNMKDSSIRAARTASLAATARQFMHPAMKIILDRQQE